MELHDVEGDAVPVTHGTQLVGVEAGAIDERAMGRPAIAQSSDHKDPRTSSPPRLRS